jgi:spermidine/putrescine transport system permease protein
MYPRWLWRGFALPGVVWLILLFIIPFYAVTAVAFGQVNPTLLTPEPVWNPLQWNIGWMNEALTRLRPGGNLWVVAVRTCEYVIVSVGMCIAIGYPVAYYIARHATRTRACS